MLGPERTRYAQKYGRFMQGSPTAPHRRPFMTGRLSTDAISIQSNSSRVM